VFNPDTGNFEPTEVPVGTVTNVNGLLVITFNDQATAVRVNAVLRQIIYGNASDAPPPSVQIDYTFDNGEVAAGSITVGITASNDAPSLDAVTPRRTIGPGRRARRFRRPPQQQDRLRGHGSPAADFSYSPGDALRSRCGGS
jgi:hypothetical protein